MWTVVHYPITRGTEHGTRYSRAKQKQLRLKEISLSRSKTIHYNVLRALGVVGWEHLEGPILAALVTESPILLIGEHGTAKSMVLERLADALGVTFRHYNASILNFDDLIGFPAPDAEGGRVRYLRSELDAWDAEAIFVDDFPLSSGYAKSIVSTDLRSKITRVLPSQN